MPAQGHGHGHHFPRAGSEVLERAFPSGRRRARAHLCVSAAPPCPDTSHALHALFPCWMQARNVEEDFLSFCFTSFVIRVCLSPPCSKTTYLAGWEHESRPWPRILPPALASSTAADLLLMLQCASLLQGVQALTWSRGEGKLIG